jgi:hypothetical protein
MEQIPPDKYTREFRKEYGRHMAYELIDIVVDLFLF